MYAAITVILYKIDVLNTYKLLNYHYKCRFNVHTVLKVYNSIVMGILNKGHFKASYILNRLILSLIER